MPEDFSSKSGLMRRTSLGAMPSCLAEARQRADLALGLEVAAPRRRPSRSDSRLSLLPGPAKLMRPAPSGVERDPLLAAGGDVDAVDQARHVLHHGRHRVGLHRVMQFHSRRQVRAQHGHALVRARS
jgi:hypothetical protein